MSSNFKVLAASANQFWTVSQKTLGQWGTRTVTLLKSPYGLGFFALFSAAVYSIYRYYASQPIEIAQESQVAEVLEGRPASKPGPTSKTLTYQLEEVSNGEVLRLQPYVQIVNPKYQQWNLKSAQKKGQLPNFKITIDSTTYYISKPFLLGDKKNNRVAVAALVYDGKDKAYPSVFYFSQSQGGVWRYISQMVKREVNGKKETGHIAKGIDEVDTNLPIELSVALAKHLDNKPKEENLVVMNSGGLDNVMSVAGYQAAPTRSYVANVQKEEFSLEKISEEDIKAADHKANAEIVKIEIDKKGDLANESYEKLGGLAPNFKGEDRHEYHFTSPLYGALTGWVYYSLDKQLRYLFCEIANLQSPMFGQAFIACVEHVQDNPILSYGIRKNFQPQFMGASLPLLEYNLIEMLGSKFEVRETCSPTVKPYICIWNYVRKLPLIQAYYEAQGRQMPPAYN